MNEMNYRFNNPSVAVLVDTKIAEAFISKPRTSEQIENFRLYASMSKESANIEKILTNAIVNDMEDTNRFRKVA